MEDIFPIDRTKNHVGARHAGQREYASPAVAMKHRQGPQLDIFVSEAVMDDHVVGVQVGISVRHDDALRATRGARGVVDGDGLVLADCGEGRFRRARLRHDFVPVRPAVRSRAFVFCDDPMLDGGQIRSDFIHDLRVFPIHQDGGHAGMVQDVLMIGSDQSVVQWDEDEANLGCRVETLEIKMRVGTEHADALAALQT